MEETAGQPEEMDYSGSLEDPFLTELYRQQPAKSWPALPDLDYQRIYKHRRQSKNLSVWEVNSWKNLRQLCVFLRPPSLLILFFFNWRCWLLFRFLFWIQSHKVSLSNNLQSHPHPIFCGARVRGHCCNKKLLDLSLDSILYFIFSCRLNIKGNMYDRVNHTYCTILYF